MAVNKPGYKSVFLDRMTSVFTSPVLEYVTFTLPVQIAIGISVSLLWSIIRFVRKVSLNVFYGNVFLETHLRRMIISVVSCGIFLSQIYNIPPQWNV
jgi:hypothetical protein